jgi:hypothetical protein
MWVAISNTTSVLGRSKFSYQIQVAFLLVKHSLFCCKPLTSLRIPVKLTLTVFCQVSLELGGHRVLYSIIFTDVILLTAPVQSTTRLANSLCPLGRICGRTHGCKRSLLKVRKGKYKGEHSGHQWNLEAKRASFSFLGTFKSYTNLWEGRNQVIPINNHCVGRGMGGSQPGDSGLSLP